MLPTWGDKWNKKWGVGPEIFTPENAATYGEWLGRRYRDAGIIWILGGDRPVESDAHQAIIAAMARGLRAGDGGAHLITFHPTGGAELLRPGSTTTPGSTSTCGRTATSPSSPAATTRRASTTTARRSSRSSTASRSTRTTRSSFKPKEHGHSIAADVRRPLYWNLFTGAFGHTYGHHSVWQMWQPGRKPINDPLMPWSEAIDQPGAAQMQHARALLESRPFLTRIPDDRRDRAGSRRRRACPAPAAMPLVATRDAAGSYAMVYAPVGRPFTVRLGAITGPKVKAWWFNPRTGTATDAGDVREHRPTTGSPRPIPAKPLDWVLVLDDAGKGYGPPGRIARPRD